MSFNAKSNEEHQKVSKRGIPKIDTEAYLKQGKQRLMQGLTIHLAN